MEATDVEILMEQVEDALKQIRADEPITYLTDESEADGGRPSEPAPAANLDQSDQAKIKLSWRQRRRSRRLSGGAFGGAIKVNAFHLLLIKIINQQDTKLTNLEDALIEQRRLNKELAKQVNEVERKLDELLNRVAKPAPGETE